MKLIKKTKITITESGNRIYWGIFLCPYCLQEVEKSIPHGRRDKSCGCNSILLRSEANKGKKHTEEHNKNISESNKGRISPMKGKKHTKESIYKIKETKIKNGGSFGELNPNWQGGRSFEIYTIEFKQIKRYILERDNYTCQSPNCTEKHKRLAIHHIDYDKQNNIPENLITLGNSCHTKTNGKNKRIYYTEFYQNIMMDKIMECLL